jgi:hypothetical protein
MAQHVSLPAVFLRALPPLHQRAQLLWYTARPNTKPLAGYWRGHHHSKSHSQRGGSGLHGRKPSRVHDEQSAEPRERSRTSGKAAGDGFIGMFRPLHALGNGQGGYERMETAATP